MDQKTPLHHEKTVCFAYFARRNPTIHRLCVRCSLALNLQFPEIDVAIIDFREELPSNLGVFNVRFVDLAVVHERRSLDL